MSIFNVVPPWDISIDGLKRQQAKDRVEAKRVIRNFEHKYGSPPNLALVHFNSMFDGEAEKFKELRDYMSALKFLLDYYSEGARQDKL